MFKQEGDTDPLRFYTEDDLEVKEEYEEYKRALASLNEDERKILEDIVAKKEDILREYEYNDTNYDNCAPRITDIGTVYHTIKKDILIELEDKLKKYAIEKFFKFEYGFQLEGSLYIDIFDGRIYKISSTKLRENFLDCSDFNLVDDRCCSAGIIILKKPENIDKLKKEICLCGVYYDI
jgi:hypothetical protein